MWFLVLPSFVSGVDDALAHAINQMVGHNRSFDIIATLPLQNDLLKAAIIGACFFAAWFSNGTPDKVQRVRRILITTLIAAVLSIGTTRTLSESIFLPRPFLRSQKIYHLEHDQLVPVRRFDWHAPLDRTSQQHIQELRTGKLWSADLGSFPSDHAGLFVSVALGICLAAPPIGALALAWTIFVILGAKLLGGQHTPLDVLAGSAIAVLWVTLCQSLGGRQFKAPLERFAAWTTRHQALTGAVLFVVLFEVCSTLYHLTSLMHGASTFLKGMVK